MSGDKDKKEPTPSFFKKFTELLAFPFKTIAKKLSDYKEDKETQTRLEQVRKKNIGPLSPNYKHPSINIQEEPTKLMTPREALILKASSAFNYMTGRSKRDANQSNYK